jgi:hypothetical protein
MEQENLSASQKKILIAEAQERDLLETIRRR